MGQQPSKRAVVQLRAAQLGQHGVGSRAGCTLVAAGVWREGPHVCPGHHRRDGEHLAGNGWRFSKLERAGGSCRGWHRDPQSHTTHTHIH